MQARLVELIEEYEKKNTLLQVLVIPYYKTGIDKKVVRQRILKRKELEKEVSELQEMISVEFYEEGEE